eukprot:8170560-Prorocentrum_lima.AAC.1
MNGYALAQGKRELLHVQQVVYLGWCQQKHQYMACFDVLTMNNMDQQFLMGKGNSPPPEYL